MRANSANIMNKSSVSNCNNMIEVSRTERDMLPEYEEKSCL